MVKLELNLGNFKKYITYLQLSICSLEYKIPYSVFETILNHQVKKKTNDRTQG